MVLFDQLPLLKKTFYSLFTSQARPLLSPHLPFFSYRFISSFLPSFLPTQTRSLHPCNYHLRLQLKETTIRRAEEGRPRGGTGEAETKEFNKRFVHVRMCACEHVQRAVLIRILTSIYFVNPVQQLNLRSRLSSNPNRDTRDDLLFCLDQDFIP